jgi:hypothetical protein
MMAAAVSAARDGTIAVTGAREDRDSARSARSDRYCTIEDVHEIVNAAIHSFKQSLSLPPQVPGLSRLERSGPVVDDLVTLQSTAPSAGFQRQRTTPAASQQSLRSSHSASSPAPRSPTVKQKDLPPTGAPDTVTGAVLAAVGTYSSDVLVLSVLQKWVNYAHRWDSRVLLLDAGVIKYYNGHGKKRVSVSMLMRGREHYTIGNKIKERYKKETRGQRKKFRGQVPYHSREDATPLGEVHISVATLRVSRSDPTKFTIYSGTKPLEIRAESTADRQRWISMLEQAKIYYDHKLKAGDASRPGASKDADLQALQTELGHLGASPGIMEVCTNWATGVQRQHAQKTSSLQDQLMELQEQLRDAVEEKHILESALLSNTGQGKSPRRSSIQQSTSDEDSETENVGRRCQLPFRL